MDLLLGGAGGLKLKTKGLPVEEEPKAVELKEMGSHEVRKASRESKSEPGNAEGGGSTRLGGVVDSAQGAKISISETTK